VRIREAVSADVVALAALITRAYQVEAFFVDGDRAYADDVRACMRRGRFLLLEDDDGSVAGCVYVEVRGTRGYVGMLSIDPARQRRGLGRRLIAAAEDLCRSAGCRDMELEVVNLRTELPPFYRHLGYAEHGTRPFPDVRRLKQPCHFIVMTKRLS
jgi:ribosomal protein S18 acetylase RimI-like enzyme